MRSKIRTNNNVSNKDVVLSIGMIVKNEEKVLRRCLESLKPLMNQIRCELIIADTGSIDSTVEIAKEYTDNVFYFEWINDFSAARNSTLEKAKGQWYMFIDADEYLDENISDLVNFFNNYDLYSKYKTLNITLRSYMDKEKTMYSDMSLPRFQKINDPENPICFKGSIHETMYIRQPYTSIFTIIHHTGYVYDSKKKHIEKKERNSTLMKEEYKKNPDDLRLISHMIDGVVLEPEELEELIHSGLEIARNNRRNFYANTVYVQTINYYKLLNPEYALELCSEYYSSLDEADKYVATISILSLKAHILSSLGRLEDAYETIVEYIKLYEDYKNGKLDISDMSARRIYGITEKEYCSHIYLATLCLKKLKRYDDALELLKCLSFDELDGEQYRGWLGTIREICQAKREYVYLAQCYGKIMNLENEDKKNLILYTLESVYYSLVSEKERHAFAKDIINSGVAGRYVELMKLILKQKDDNDFRNRLLEYVNEIDNWKYGYSESIYLSIKYGIDISDAVEKMDSSLFRVKLEELAHVNDDFAGYVYNYGIPESYTTSIKKFYWITSLYEKASYRSFKLDDNKRYELYNRFVSLLGDYVMNIYNPELLNDEDIQVLPNLHKFGFYMYQANSALNAGDKVGYIRGMKKALTNCESMKEIVEFMLEQFKKSIK